jgi:hypothetical protein
MSKEDIQAIWDDCLIRSWLANTNKAHLVAQFMLRVPNTVELHNVPETVNFILSLELKRCRDKDVNGSFVFTLNTEPVRAFVEKHSTTLSSWLWSDKYTPEQMVEGIYTAKWVRLSQRAAKNTASKRRENRLNYDRTKHIPERIRTPGWEKVK